MHLPRFVIVAILVFAGFLASYRYTVGQDLGEFIDELPPGVSRWQYMCKGFPVNERPGAEYLNQLGQSGWELAGIDEVPAKGAVFYFKRPIIKPKSSREPKR